jgi:hypothetical protein
MLHFHGRFSQHQVSEKLVAVGAHGDADGPVTGMGITRYENDVVYSRLSRVLFFTFLFSRFPE